MVRGYAGRSDDLVAKLQDDISDDVLLTQRFDPYDNKVLSSLWQQGDSWCSLPAFAPGACGAAS
eukprot:8347555-Karenia_brevis.AAC.1